MSEEKNSTSLKEFAAKLNLSDALLKKIIKDFAIDTIKVKNRVHLESPCMQTVKEIVALRASGKKTQEIKEMFDASKQNSTTVEAKPDKNTETDTNSQDKNANQEKNSPKTKKTKKKNSKSIDAKKTQEDLKDKEKSEFKDKKKKNNKKSLLKNNLQKNSNREAINDNKKQDEEPEDDESAFINLNEYLDNDIENDLKANLDILDDESELDDLEEDYEEEDFDDDFEEDDDIEDANKGNNNSAKANSKKKSKVRRRQFSYKYIQRQIMNDQKRVNYIKQKLQRGRLSTTEKMRLEESLEIRDKLLAGWHKLLRWVKS